MRFIALFWAQSDIYFCYPPWLMPICWAIRKNIRERHAVFWFVHRTNSCSRRKRLTKRQRDIRGAYRPQRSAKEEVPRNACRSSINTNRHLRPVTPVRGAENRRTTRGSVHMCAYFYALIWTIREDRLRRSCECDTLRDRCFMSTYIV